MEETKQKVIKILAITKQNDGAKFHRVEYGLGKLHNTEIEGKRIEVTLKEYDENTLKEAEDYSIFAYHWDIPVKHSELGQLQAKGIKVLYLIDDFYTFSILHPDYFQEQLRNYTEQRIRTHLLNADCVIVTTQRLAWNCLQYNDNVAIIPNFLNPVDFKIGEKTKSDKLRIALIGSRSHYPDYLMLKQVVNKLAKNKKIAENCQFQICGVDSNDAKWQEIIQLFKVKKNLDVIVKEFLSVDRYLEFYQDTDISLLPLEMTEFNYCKSALKLAENALTNTLPVGSSLYSAKELKGIVVAETPEDFSKTIEKLLDKDYYNQVLKYVTETNLKDNNWEKRFEDTKLVINTVYSENLSTKLDDIKLFSITYDENQVAEYTPYMNWRKEVKDDSIYFEYPCICDIIDNKLEEKDAYLGVFSWKLSQKTGFTKNILLKSLKHYNYQDYDVINLSPKYRDLENNYLNWSNLYHPTFLDKFTKLCKHLGLEVKEPENVIFSNQFIAKKEVYTKFVTEVIKPTIQYLKTEMLEEGMENAKYSVGLNEEECLKHFGLSYYPLASFLPERLISVWLENNKQLKVKNLL